MSQFLLNPDGNINTAKLEKDLQQALDFDRKYKLTDNMKKRAVKVAADYDEFRAMVACAHLKTVTRKEISSLGVPKKGWQKGSRIAGNGTGTLILNDEQKNDHAQHSALKLSVEAVKKPKSPMELERDWRRLSNDDEKVIYLSNVGLKRIKTLVGSDGNAEFLESLLGVVLYAADCAWNTPIPYSDLKTEEAPVATAQTVETLEDGKGDDGKEEPPETKFFSTFKWLKAISTIDKFSLMIRLISNDVIEQVVNWLRASNREGSEELINRYRPV